MNDSIDPYATPESSMAEATEASRIRRKKTLVILGATGGAFLVFGLMVAVLMTSESYPVNDEDRKVLVTIEDLAVWLDTFEPVKSGETVTKERYVDGAWEVTYEYDHPVLDTGLYASCAVTVDTKKEDASTTYISMKYGLGLGLQMADGESIRQVERNELFKWGDQSHNALLMRGGDPVGNAFVGRKGTRVFMLVTAGLYFDDADTLRGLLQPKLRALEAYQPRR